MIKKFFAVVILFLFMFNSQTVSAEVPIDWSNAPQIGNKVELASYIENERRKGETKFYVILTNGLKVDLEEFSDLAPAPRVEAKVIDSDENNTRMIYTIKEYPGTRVANAYLSGDIGWLSTEEMKLYNVAVSIVHNAKRYSSSIDRELYIHETICNRVTYYNEDAVDHMPNFVNAIGALLDGKANCQGYSDSFYMLSRMCGFNVCRIDGKTNDGEHQWNTIEFGDGTVYCVDVTFDDEKIDMNKSGKFNSYIYFNAPLEVMQETHSYQWEVIPNLQRTVDERYSYNVLGNLAKVSDTQEGIDFIAKKFAEENETWFSVMVPFDKKFSKSDARQQAVDKIAKESSKNITLNTWEFGKYIFFTAATRNS